MYLKDGSSPGLFSGATRPSTSATPTLGTITTAYDAEYTTVTDPAGKKRRSRLDGLGRLVRVDEPNSSGELGATGSPNQTTSYSYNALDNLTRVTQGTQTRTFLYDSLSRLTKATNPESGTVGYAYDNNGNLTRKRDARGVVTDYSYDRLDRLTRRDYSYTGSDTAVSLGTTRVDYAYDRCGSYARGRLCSVTARNGQTEVSRTAYNRYDALGRVLESTQRTGGSSYTMAYGYDRAGNLISQRYPSGRVLDYVYDEAGRIAGAKTGTDDWYAQGEGDNAVAYEPHGGMKDLLLGNGLWEQRRYNARLQPTQIGLGTGKTAAGTALSTERAGMLLLDYSYGTASNNGNVLSQRIRAGTLNQIQRYTYDSLNRLKTAKETGSGALWSQTYAYDRWGNRRVTPDTDRVNSYLPQPVLTPQITVDIDTATNRLAGTKGVNTIGYDPAGNLKADWAGNTFTYDGDNRLVAFNTTGTDSDTTYSYDGEGRRVQKAVGGSGGVTTTYVYNVLGQLVAEFGGTAPDRPGTRYLTPDHLGSTRVVTGEGQSVLSRHDYLPFGEEIEVSRGNRSAVKGYTASLIDGPAQKFTGKERDGESGLDYFGARYYGGATGRFTGVDPKRFSSRTVANPQKWNKYAYVLNNPLAFVDPNGQEEIKVTFRTFIPEKSLTFMGQTFSGDNRSYSSAPVASSRTHITVRLETDASIRSSPIISVSGGAGATNLLGASGEVTATATARTGLPTATAIRDAKGGVVLSINQSVKNPLVAAPAAFTPDIGANLTLAIPQDASRATVTGSLDNFPAHELNVTRADGNVTSVMQFTPPTGTTPLALLPPDMEVNRTVSTPQCSTNANGNSVCNE